MLLSGTTTFTDMYYFEDVVAEASKEAGMRGVLGETIIGFPVADAKTPAAALAFTEKYLTRFADTKPSVDPPESRSIPRKNQPASAIGI